MVLGLEPGQAFFDGHGTLLVEEVREGMSILSGSVVKARNWRSTELHPA
jgi:hypothetical protein